MRTTFRQPCTEVAWQKQLRDQYLAEGAPPVRLDLSQARVRPVGVRLARQIVLKYEWLGTMAQTKTHYGIFFGPYCAGVCCVGDKSCLAAPYLADTFRVPADAVRILARGACVHWAPSGTNSKLVAWTARLLAKDQPEARVLIAYTDTDAGEVGTIYQAAGWFYLGPTQGGRCELVAPNGRICNSILVNKMVGARGLTATERIRFLEEKGWRRQRYNPKHRYVCLLDRTDPALRERVLALSRPYPKRG